MFTRSCADERKQFGHMLVAFVAGRRFEVQPQQRLGVRRAQVEPPGAAVDREPVEAIAGRPANSSATRSMTAVGSSTWVLISPLDE